MRIKKEKKDEIIKDILDRVDKRKAINSFIVEKHGITRQTVNNYLRELVKNEIIEKQGKNYEIAIKVFDKKYKINGLEEDIVYEEFIKPLIVDYKSNVQMIINYSFTEMLNNAIDHSESKDVEIIAGQTYEGLAILIQDNGVGIFRKIKENKNLKNEKQAILELKKGKLTTDNKNHTGEGIFFTSRMTNVFKITSFGDVFTGNKKKDKIFHDFERENENYSTQVAFLVWKNSEVTPKEIFERYQDEDDCFAKTEIIVKLVKEYEKNLISRSVAKRILNNLEKFKEITFDYKGIENIGQGFADQIYRVFQNENPEVILNNINVNEEIEFMINRAKKRM